LDGATGGN